MRMSEDIGKSKSSYIHVLAVVIITVLCCIHIRALNYIFIINDEFGYWAHAISAVGYDLEGIDFYNAILYMGLQYMADSDYCTASDTVGVV